MRQKKIFIRSLSESITAAECLQQAETTIDLANRYIA
jgi:hypothetical protein